MTGKKKQKPVNNEFDQIIKNYVDFSFADKEIDSICLKGKEWNLQGLISHLLSVITIPQ